jgi:hypothetical protein
MGLADHTIVPDVAEPLAADCVAPPAAELLLPLLLQPARVSAPTTPTRAVTCQLLTERLPGYLRDLALVMRPPLKVVTS